MVLADGMGGHPRGELAAEIAVRHLGAAFESEARPALADPGAFLVRELVGAHAAILGEARRLGLRDTPRTVIVACVVQGGRLHWTHVGDCRLYLVRAGRILARSRDHTLVQRLADEGRIREEAISAHPDRNRLLQCLGGVAAPRPEPPASAPMAKDDVVLLCSDGLWAPLTPRQLVHALVTRGLEQAVAELVALAEQRAGSECDNVSVIALSWGEDEVGA